MTSPGGSLVIMPSAPAPPFRRPIAARSFLRLAVVLAALAIGVVPPQASAASPVPRAADPPPLRTGVLYDRVLPLSGIERFDGSAGAPAATPATWRQIVDELRRASQAADLDAGAAVGIEEVARASRSDAVIPLAVVDRA